MTNPLRRKEEQVLGAIVDVRFKISSVIDQQSLDDVYAGDISAAVKELIKDEGLMGIVDDMDGEILSISPTKETV